MSEYDYDLFVIGAGSGGVRASRVAARHGARVAIAEESRVGGTCVIRGCIPKKILVYASHVREEIEDAKGYGWSIPKPSFDWATLIADKDREIDRLNLIYKDLLAQSGVTLFEARARLVEAHTVQVGGKRVSADKILIAVGGWPVKPDTPGSEHMVTSNEALELTALPQRVLIGGGGYIAVEFAGIFHGLGAEVVQIHRGDKILRGFDEDVRSTLAAHLRARGIDLRCGKTIQRVDKLGEEFHVKLSDGSTVDTDLVLMATGRKPLTADFGLEQCGVELDHNGAVKVDEYSQSSVENIYAIGDCTNRLNLTPVAIREGMAFADTVFGGTPTAMDHTNIASAVFSQPPVAVVGLTEEQARRRLGAIDVYKTMFRPLKQILPRRDERTLMKLIVERSSQKVVGAHMVGQDSPEILQGVAIAVKMGATKADFDATVPIHPTAAEEWVTLRVKEADPIAEAAE